MRAVIRRATHDDLDALVALHVASFRAGNEPHLPASERDRMTPERSRSGIGLMLDAAPGVAVFAATDGDGAMTGLATAGPTLEVGMGDTAGQLFALYVDPPAWGRGHGAALDRAAREHLAGASFAFAVLWVLEGNAGARAFYERRGWRPDGATRPHAGATAVRYRVVL